jgi:CRP-like cAMP-binding protein
MTKSSSAGNFGVILASFAPRKCEDPQKNSFTAPIPAASTLEKSMSMIKTEALLQRIPLFTDVPTDELVPIAEVTQKSIYKRGDTIIRRGHVPPGLVIILNGRAHELARNVSESKEVILDQYSTGDCLGFSGLIGAQQHPTSIIASCPIDALFVPRHSFDRVIASSAALASAMTKDLVRRLRHAQARVTSLALYDVPDRVKRHLLAHAEQLGDGRYFLRQPISVQEVALNIGASREAVSRALKDLRTDGLLLPGEPVGHFIANRLIQSAPMDDFERVR